jgi:cell division protease FtsH
LILTGLLPVILIGGFIFFMMRQAQGTNNQALSFGKSRARMFLGNKTVVTFADVAGVDEAKTELQEVVEFLKYPEKFNSLGARIPRGVLLVGPPGTGKTLMARAVAGEAGVPFFSISGSEFVEMFVGVGASRVRDLFDQAKRNSPCIVFVDEIDAVGRQRGAGLGGSHDEREQTLNQILVEMDGFDTNTNVIVVAATNRPDVLDPALLRPGRFDRQVILDRPDMKGRVAILKVHTKGKPLDKSIDVDNVARQSPGFSGADLANLVNESAILAARRNKKVIGMPEFQEALERIVAGPERKSRVISDAEKVIIAYHEGGHAIVQRILPKCDPVQKVTIISRGMALGYTMALPTEDRYLQSKTEFEDKIAGLLGGNASEKLIFGDTTTGASNDIEKATMLARRMVTEFGMSEKLGPLSFGKRDELVFLGREIGEQRNYSDDVAKMIDEEVRAIIDRGYARAMDVLVEYRDKLTALAEKLVAEETVDADEFEKLFTDLPPKEDRGAHQPQPATTVPPVAAASPSPSPA